MKLLVNGAKTLSDAPGLAAVADQLEIAFAHDAGSLAAGLPGAEVLLEMDFRGRDLATHWARGDRLRWIHWCGAGVDAALFPELVNSDVVLTNARGIFDAAMAEYVLAYLLAETMGLRATWQAQAARRWAYRHRPGLAGTRAAVFGVGSIGREIARLLRAVGVAVTGVGRSPRDGDPDFGRILGRDDRLRAAAEADWLIGVMPNTPETEGFFSAALFAAAKPGARFVNVGRGTAVDETALQAALEAGRLAGAMLDVFREEPLPAASPLWAAPDLTVSPHMSGDYIGCKADLVAQFLGNLDRYRAGRPLDNVVDKRAGYVRG